MSRILWPTEVGSAGGAGQRGSQQPGHWARDCPNKGQGGGGGGGFGGAAAGVLLSVAGESAAMAHTRRQYAGLPANIWTLLEAQDEELREPSYEHQPAGVGGGGEGARGGYADEGGDYGVRGDDGDTMAVVGRKGKREKRNKYAEIEALAAEIG